MSAPAYKQRPGPRFVWLSIITLGLCLLIGGGYLWSNASLTPKLALDLEGGTSIVLSARVDDGSSISTEQLEQAVAIIRQRVDSTGVSEAQITTQGDRNIVVNLPGNPDEETRELVRSSAQLMFRRVAVAAPGQPSPQPGEQEAEQPKDPAADLSEEERKRLDELVPAQPGAPGAPADGVPADGQPLPEAPLPEQDDPQGGGTVAASELQVPGNDDAPAVTSEDTVTVPRFDPETDQSWMQDEELMKQFMALDCSSPANLTGGASGDQDSPMVACSSDGMFKYVLGPVELQGKHVTDGEMGFETSPSGQQTNRPAVNISFDDYGKDTFGQITSAITGKQQPYNQFAMVLDGLVLSAPTSNTAVLDGRAQITGGFTVEEAQTLANQLKNGALPISFDVQTEQQISPTLGSEYLAKGMLAGGIGLLLVVIYSLVQYRVLGTLTVSSLAVAGLITYLLLLFVTWRYGYRLSLAGVAGLIVGVGAAADSFIVYFERIRDELRMGRKLTSAVEVGWARAKQTIYASKAVNMLAAVILYVLAVGNVRGFAFTLGLTVIVDVLVVILFTHPMMQVLARSRFFGEGHPMSGMDPRKLGVSKAAYRGALNLDVEHALDSQAKDGKSAGEVKRRQSAQERKRAHVEGLTLAERKAAARKESVSTDSSADTGSATASVAGTSASGKDD